MTADAFGRFGLLMLLALSMPSIAAAEDLEPLDADFLVYLAELEGDGDDWTIVESPASESTATSKPVATDRPREKPSSSARTEIEGDAATESKP